MVDNQDDYRTEHGDQQTVQIQSGYNDHPESIEQPAADYSSHHAQANVEKQTFTGFVDELASNEAGDETQNDPSYD